LIVSVRLSDEETRLIDSLRAPFQSRSDVIRRVLGWGIKKIFEDAQKVESFGEAGAYTEGVGPQ
jgi:Arc/MetJ-type ribon-helix-helix transcriptional regulator